MPRRGRNQLIAQKVFFATTTVRNHQNLFHHADTRRVLRSILFRAVRQHEARLFGYVLMPNHFHVLIGLNEGGPQLSKLMRDIKSISARMIFPGRGSVWMQRFDDVAIYSEEQFRTKLNYIHQNPVKAGLVLEPEDWEDSSAISWSHGIDDGVIQVQGIF